MRYRLTLLLVAALLGSACSSFKIFRYGLSADHVTGLRQLGEKANVGGFTASTPGRTEIGCRGRGP